MQQGWIKLYRKLSQSDFWLSEKFSRPQAWIDLLLLANHAPGYIRKRGIKIIIKRGEIGYSERELAKRWHWSRGKVRRYLCELKSDSKIEIKTVPQTVPQNDPQTVPQNKNVTTVIHVIKYKLYQTNEPQTVPQSDPKAGHQTVPEQEEEEDKKNNIKEKIYKKEMKIPKSLDTPEFKIDWQNWLKHLSEQKKKPTPSALAKQLEKCELAGLENAIKMIDFSIERSYKGLFEKPNNNFNQKTQTKNTNQVADASAFDDPKTAW